jgi:hypothetical protein
MKYRLLTIFLLTTIISSGQTIAPFKDTDFSADKFVVKKQQRTLGAITVDLIHAKPRKQDDSRQFSCRTWLTIKDKNKLIKELAQDADAVGGCSGLFFPASQPNKDLIIISKFGDYDGRLYVVNSKGEFKDYLGGKFYVSNDNKYLFTNYDSDLSGVSIIDLTKNELIYTGELKQYLADWYFQDGQYFAIVSEDVKINGETELVIFDFRTKSFTTKRTKEKIDPRDKLKVYNDYQKAPDCSCGK